MSKSKRSKRRNKKDEQPEEARPALLWPAPEVEHPCSLAKWGLTASTPRGRKPRRMSAKQALARAGDEGCGEVWLWCLHCHRFFQAKHLVRGSFGEWEICPYEDCGAPGLDFDIYHWTECTTLGDRPAEHELQAGLQFPPCHCPRCTAARERAMAASPPASSSQGLGSLRLWPAPDDC